MSVAVRKSRQGTTKFTGCPISFTIFDFQEIPIQNAFNFVHNYKAASHFPDDELGRGGGWGWRSYIWVGMVIKIATITLEKAKQTGGRRERVHYATLAG